MTKDAEKLLKQIADMSEQCNDIKVTIDINKIQKILSTQISINNLLDELKSNDFISSYEDNIYGEINVNLMSNKTEDFYKNKRLIRVSGNDCVVNITGGQLNVASGNASIISTNTGGISENELPIEITYDFQYLKSLYEHLSSYYNFMLSIIGDNHQSIGKIRNNIDLIKRSLNCYYNGRIKKAYECIKKILTNYINSPYIVASINENYAFKGLSPKIIRPNILIGDEDYANIYENMLAHELSFFKARVASEKIIIKDMLHIPFDKRSLVSTQRFSIPGIPCIYLSTTSFGCWLELGTPESDIFQVSSFKIPTNLKVLNLCIRWKFIEGMIKLANTKEEREVIFDFYEIYPLVIATSYHIREINRKFKSEYIISQIVMQVCNELKIDGIAYLSKRITDYYAYPQAVNLAISVPYNVDLLYWEKANEVLITEPVRFSDFCEMKIANQGIAQFSSYVNEIYKNSLNNDIWIAGNEMKYTDTKFSAFDEYLVSQKFKSFINFSSENRLS